MGNVIRAIGKGIHKVLDYISFNWCPERPTYRLATDNLHIPDDDMTVIMQIVNLIAKGLGLLIAPFQMLSDKKFTIHIYETATVFVSPNNPAQHNIVPTCERMLMYIAQNRNKIIEPVSKQIIKTVTLQDRDYDIPVNFWYNFKIDNEHKVYFFAHISVLQNYRGVVIAVDRRNADNLVMIKQIALDFYDQTIGAQNAPYNNGQRMDFI